MIFGDDVKKVQNPAYGAILIHSLVVGYSDAHPEKSPMPLPYVFVAMPCLFSPEILEVVRHTQAGLRAVSAKLSSSRAAQSDLILSLAARAKRMRRLTIDSIAVLLSAHLVAIDIHAAALVALKPEVLKSHPDSPPEANEARKLGTWMAPLSPFEISSLLKVSF